MGVGLLVAYHYHHQSLNREGRWGTTDDFATSFLHFSPFSTALWDLPTPGLEFVAYAKRMRLYHREGHS